MDIESKVDDMRAMLWRLEPVISASAKTIDSLDVRQRAMEIKAAENDVRLARVVTDLDGLGRKIAHNNQRAETAHVLKTPMHWTTIADAMAAIPKYWHIALSIGSVGWVAATVLLRHWPRGG